MNYDGPQNVRNLLDNTNNNPMKTNDNPNKET